MFGTSSEREPSFFSTSMARPMLTSSRSMRVGVPSLTVKAAFIRGYSFSDLTMAQAMMCVNDAFGWPLSAKWLLMTRRFSSSTLTGMLRTDVAVGTVSDVSMFATILLAAPRSGTAVPGGLGTAVGRAAGGGAASGG